MLARDELDYYVHTLMDLEEEMDRLKEEIDSVKNVLKNEMEARGEYFLEGSNWKITWNLVASKRFDQSLFRAKNPDLFTQYLKLSESRRFLLSKE